MEKDTLRIGTQLVGARLSHFAQNWDSNFLQRRLKAGWLFRWKATPPDMDKGEILPESEADRATLQQHNEELLQKEAWSDPHPSHKGAFSRCSW